MAGGGIILLCLVSPVWYCDHLVEGGELQSNFNISNLLGNMEICSRYRGLVMAPGQEANGDSLRISFRPSTQQLYVECTLNIQSHEKKKMCTSIGRLS